MRCEKMSEADSRGPTGSAEPSLGSRGAHTDYSLLCSRPTNLISNLDNLISAEGHHVVVTSNYTDDDVDAEDGHKLQFSRATPSVQTQAYLRVMDPEKGVAPTPQQIVHDMTRAERLLIVAVVVADAQSAAEPARRGAGQRASARRPRPDVDTSKYQMILLSINRRYRH
eukprot:COSAG03_NODE_2671_length_2535_cov_2.260263_1_plen_169_part_00